MAQRGAGDAAGAHVAPQAIVEFTPAKLRRLKCAYKHALEHQQKTGEDVFVFEENEYVVGYARYLIEHLEMKLGKG